MALDEKTENDLIAAIKAVHEMPWPKAREAALLRALDIILKLLNLEIVKIDRQSDDNTR